MIPKEQSEVDLATTGNYLLSLAGSQVLVVFRETSRVSAKGELLCSDTHGILIRVMTTDTHNDILLIPWTAISSVRMTV